MQITYMSITLNGTRLVRASSRMINSISRGPCVCARALELLFDCIQGTSLCTMDAGI